MQTPPRPHLPDTHHTTRHARATQVVGRLAAQLSLILQGKDKPIFAPHKDHGDVCVVVNAEKAVLTGNKWDGKLYRWHTGRPGGLKEVTAREMWRRDPTQVLSRAVEGMLPKNNLRPDRMRKLRVFAGPEHPYGRMPMVPWAMPPKRLEDHRRGWAVPEGFAPMNPAAYARRMLGARRVAGAGGGGGGGAAAAPAAASSSGGEQQEEQQGQQGQVRHAAAPVISFDDLLAADERQFVEQCLQQQQQQQRGGQGSGSGGGGGAQR